MSAHSLKGTRGWTAIFLASALAAFAAFGCSAKPEPTVPKFTVDQIMVEALGGDTTAFTSGRNAFELSARNLTTLDHRTFEVGDSFFNQNWVTAPSSTEARDGLGPMFNAMACSSCHTHDGRGRPPNDDKDPTRGFLIRLSIPGPNGPEDDPVYGGQFQDGSIIGVPPEGHVTITYTPVQGQFADGTPYTLMKPSYTIDRLNFGPLHPDIMISPRVAPAMIGLGLLEAVPEQTILAMADPFDRDGDGISGRANVVPDIRTGKTALGRFGWKAGLPTVEQQAEGAFNGDIGITSTMFPNADCTPVQTDCLNAPNGGQPEISDEILEQIAFYSRTLAVPSMRNVDDPVVRRGAELFLSSGCASCHVPEFKTGDSTIPELANQTIFPYTDLLLHDMGEGLADNRPEFGASGQEWRTPPLWGIGLVETVNGHTRFLHDGRARNLTEAILWHGGEATDSRDIFRNLSADDRAALLKFLSSL